MVTSQDFHFYTVKELLAMLSPQWLVENVLETGALGVLYGPSNTGKSFVALDLALSVALGVSWHGHATKKGSVIYVVGEGTTGAKKRVRGWMAANKVDDVDGAFFLLQAPQLADPRTLTSLIAEVQKQQPKPELVVFDTFARCFVGGDENSAKEVGLFLDRCRHFQRQTGVALLLVHHSGKPNAQLGRFQERGSSALRAAADVMILQTRIRSAVQLVNDKQKDSEEFPKVRLRLQQVKVGEDDAGNPVHSCVLVPNTDPDTTASSSIGASRQRAIDVLAVIGPATAAAWRSGIESAFGIQIPVNTFNKWPRALIEAGLVESDASTPRRYHLTPAGRERFRPLPATATPQSEVS